MHDQIIDRTFIEIVKEEMNVPIVYGNFIFVAKSNEVIDKEICNSFRRYCWLDAAQHFGKKSQQSCFVLKNSISTLFYSIIGLSESFFLLQSRYESRERNVGG